MPEHKQLTCKNKFSKTCRGENSVKGKRNVEKDNFCQKCFLKNNNETNKPQQNIILNPKKNLPDILHGKAVKAKQ